jgi:DNA repair exonuclease SbcCD ATPase subunit
MHCDLEINDVGGLKGSHNFSFDSGKVVKVKGTNASGKSSFIKALISVLSLPEIGHYLKYEREAERLGIKGDELSVHEGFVNIYSKNADVHISYDGYSDSYSVKPNGDILLAPRGNEKFLLTGASMDNSRVVQQLKSGENSSFGWLIDELSFADSYENLRLLASNYYRDVESKKKSVIDRKLQSEKLSLQLESLLEEKKIIDFKKDDLAQKIQDSDIRQIVKKRDDKFKQIERANDSLNEKNGRFNTLDRDIEYKKKQLESIKKKIDSLEEELLSLDIESFESTYNKRKLEIDGEIGALKIEKSKIDGTLNIFQSAQIKLHRDGVSQIKCILCDEGQLDVQILESKLDTLMDEKRTVESKIQSFTSEFSQMQHSLRNLLEEKKRKQEEIDKLKPTINHDESRLQVEIDEVEDLKHDIESTKRKIQGLENEYNELKLLAKGDILDELDSLDQQSLQLQRKIGAMEEKINTVAGLEVIFNQTVSLDESLIIYDKWINYLHDLEQFAKMMYTEHREEARRNFNSNVNTLIKDLGFKGFDSVWLNNEDRLMVEREGEKPQPVGSLCLSEKCTVAILLQLSMKETYLPGIPFFIVDDILQDFDEDRKEKLLNYLDNVAKEKDMFILISWLDENVDNVMVVQ